MSKRFTDSRKWRNEWFRTLPLKAKLAWVYLCDECESHGVMKMDYGLATFQLGFSVTPEILADWFGSKLYFFSDEKFLIVQYFNFQYGESKDTWSAKIEAKKKLEVLGFTILNNEVQIPSEENETHSAPTVVDSVPTPLIRVRGRVRGNNKGGMGEKEISAQVEIIYATHYPLKKGKSDGIKKLVKDLRTEQDLIDFESAVIKYAEDCQNNQTPQKFIKHFASFAGSWRDWLAEDVGTSTVGPQAQSTLDDSYFDPQPEIA